MNKSRFAPCAFSRARKLRQWVSIVLLLTTVVTQGQVALLASVRAGTAVAVGASSNSQPAAEPAKGAAQKRDAAVGARQETQSERDTHVASIKVEPQNPTALVNQQLQLGATAFDGKNIPVGGVLFSWKLSGGPEGKAAVSSDGVFTAKSPGDYEVTVEGAWHVAAVKVRVVSELEGAALSSADAGAANALVLDESRYIWNEDNYLSARRPENQRGERQELPPAVNSNFSFTVPLLSLPGRGLNLDLGLTYNSRVWNVAGSEVTFDIDKDWPAPGWSFSLPKLVKLGPKGAMLVAGDGTRHAFHGTTSHTPGGIDYSFKGYTTDGTFIKYSTQNMGGGVAYYPNGTTIRFGSGVSNTSNTGIWNATEISDRHGNRITIRRDDAPGGTGLISSMVDSLGRSIFFYYDSRKLLTAITVASPRDEYGNVEMRVLARFHYRKLRLSYSFTTDLAPLVRNGEPYVIDAIYFPATSTGYWFGEYDSYSSYGMIRKVVQQRGMGFVPATSDPGESLSMEGQITPGATTLKREYDYTLTASSTLNAAPTYSRLDESWEGMQGEPRRTRFEVDMGQSPRRVKIIRPDNSYTIRYSENKSGLDADHPEKFKDGLLLEEEVYSAGNTLLSKSKVVNWLLGDLKTPSPTRIENYLYREGRAPLVTKVEVDYGEKYNTPDVKREYDFNGTLIRTTRTVYRHHDSETGPRLVNLVQSQEVFAGTVNDARLAYVVNQYDEEVPTGVPPGVVQHLGASMVPRGNLTSTTSYIDSEAGTGALTQRFKYDVFGNLISSTTPDGVHNTYRFELATQYAYPTVVTTGSPDPASPVRNTVSAVYDFNSGLVVAAKDANGREVRFFYDSPSTRRTRMLLPTGAYTDFSYDDNALTVTNSTYASGGGQPVERSVVYLNGAGQSVKTESLTDGGQWSVVNTEYDVMNRVRRSSRPYFRGQTPHWVTNTYDDLGRLTSIKQADESVTGIFYDEPSSVRPLPTGAGTVEGRTARSVDPWGRERWALLDRDGRLVEVVEAHPDGDGTISADGYLTKYRYDALGRLFEVEQGEQRRKFKYDGLSRITHSKLAEQAATLNDAGQYVGPAAGIWSDFLSYEGGVNLRSVVDARGVKTVFNYGSDPLNRLQSVGYEIPPEGQRDDSAPILPAAQITYQYKSDGDLTRLWKVITDPINTPALQAPGSTEEFGYDIEGRVERKTQTMSNLTGQPLVVRYEYDSLGRLKNEHYPEQYGTNRTRKQVRPEYAVGSQLTGLLVNDTSYASLGKYNATGQLRSLRVGPAGIYQKIESFDYDERTGLAIGQKVTQGSTTLLDLTYDYLRAGTSEGRTGQLTKVLNNLDHTKDRAYEYDALARLKKVTGGASASWWQLYSYDRFGNRLSVSKGGTLAEAQPPTLAEEPLAEIAALAEPPTFAFLLDGKRRDTTDAPDFSPLRRAPVTAAPATTAPAAAAAAPAAAPAAAAFADYDGHYVSHVYLNNTDADITMRNTGSKSWVTAIFNADGNVRLCGLHVPGNLDNRIIGGAPLPDFAFHPPNTNVTFKVRTGGIRAGTYNARFQLCREKNGIIYFGQATPLFTFTIPPTMPYDAVLVSTNIPATMNLGQSYVISLTYKNNGTDAWLPQHFRLQSTTTGFDSLLPDGAHFQLPRTINPGETVTFDIPVSAPFEPGTYKARWQMLFGNNNWFFGDAAGEFSVQVVRPEDGALFTNQRVPSWMVAGQTYPVSVIMKNSGSNTWQQSLGYALGSLDEPDNTTWGTHRVSLPQASVASTLDTVFDFNVTAPSQPGRYSFQWGMVRDGGGTQRFGEPSQRVLVDVVAPDATPTPTPIATPTPTPVPKINVGLDYNGGVATASSSRSGSMTVLLNDGNRIGTHFLGASGVQGLWADATPTFPDWVQLTFDRVRNISEINVIAGQNWSFFNPMYPPTLGMTATQFNSEFKVMYWNSALNAWTLVPDGHVVGNNRVWRRFVFPEVSTDKIMVEIKAANVDYSHLVELEAYEIVQPTPTPTPTPIPTPQPEQLPFGTGPHQIPGVIEAEDFDKGGEGVAYHDADAYHHGGTYRDDTGVDTEPTADVGGGHNVGWLETGEWIEYSVRVPTSGLYKLEARVASEAAGRKLRFDFDGVDKTGEMVVPNTGGHQVWQTINSYVRLHAGEQTMRVEVTAGGGGYNLNYVRLTAVSPDTAPVNLAANKAATQSSTFDPQSAADKAVDSNTEGSALQQSISSTNIEQESWWEVDLGSPQAIDNIRIWNRTDCCADRLNDFYVFVSDAPFTSNDSAATMSQPGVSFIHIPGQSGRQTTLTVNRTGRYVRVQLAGSNYLSMAEVEVWGASTPAPSGLLADDFNDNSRDPLKWDRIAPGSSVLVAETNARLEITSNPQSLDFDGYVSAEPINLTDARVTVEVPHPSSAQNQETRFDLRVGENEGFGFVVVNGSLVMRQYVLFGGVLDFDETEVTYQLSKHRFLRLRHDEHEGLLYWETSNDGEVWTVQRSVVPDFPLNSLSLRLSGGPILAVTPGPPPDTAFFDNLKVELNNPNIPPTISLTAPADNSVFSAPASITLNAAADDADGYVSKVSFYSGATKLGDDATAPYSFTWTNVAQGVYALHAVAFDERGGSTTSDPIHVNVTQPTVNITATAPRAAEPGIVAADKGAFTVTRDGSTASPLNVNVTYAGTAVNGSDYHSVSQTVTIPAGSSSQVIPINPIDDAIVEGKETVIATLSGASSAYSRGINFIATVELFDNELVPPSVQLTSPTNGTGFTPPVYQIDLAASASDDGRVVKVEFYAGATKLGEATAAPYVYAWKNVASGAYVLTAKATDDQGVTVTSAAVNINVTSTAALDDDFNDNAMDAAKWSLGTPAGVTVAEQNQRLEITPPANGTGYDGYSSQPTVDLTDARAAVEVVQNAGLASGVTTGFALADNSNGNRLHFHVGSNGLLLQEIANGVTTNQTISYDATQHRFWRFRHDPSADTVHWETSADGFAWVTRRSSPRAFALTNLQVQLFAGKHTAGAAATTAIFDNLRVARYRTLFEDFNDNSLDASRWQYLNSGSSQVVQEINAQLRIALQPHTNGYFGIRSVAAYDLINRTLKTRVVQAVDQGGAVEMRFQAMLDDNNGFLISAGAGSLKLTSINGGLSDSTTVGFDPARHRHWRLRHDAATNRVSFETSADGQRWETLKAVPVSFPLGALRVGLVAGASGNGNSWPGSAIFDDVVLYTTEPNQPPTVSLTAPAAGASFVAPASVELTADAADPDGAIAKVEFYAGATKLGEDTTAPYSYAWATPSAGAHTLTAKATASVGAAAPQALLVVGSASLVAGDVALKSRLEGLGFSVTVKDAVGSAASDAIGKALVVISESVASADVNNKFRDVIVPVLVLEMQVYDDMQMTGPVLGTDYNSQSGHTQVSITNASHPLAAGLSGTVTVASPAQMFAWGKPSLSAINVAALATDASKSTVFGYESGTAMMGMNAPARRVGLFVCKDTPNGLNQSGWALFDAAVNWSANTSSYLMTTTSSPVNINILAPTVSINATDANASEAGPDAGSFNVTRNGGTSTPLTVSFGVGGTATSGADYTALGMTVTIPAGAASAQVVVTPLDDALVEGAETVVLTIAANQAYSVGAASAATVTITDNDINPPTISIINPTEGTSFIAPDAVTIDAVVPSGGGQVTKVEFYAGTTKVGEDTAAPYSTSWAFPAPGSHALTAKATANTVALNALLVVGATPLIAGDTAIKSRLESLGFNVTVKDDDLAVTNDAAGQSLVFISESVASTAVNNKFRDVAVPVINNEAGLHDDMQMTGPVLGTDYNNEANQTQVAINNASHPLAAGLSGTVTVTTAAAALAWGKPSLGAIKVAALAGDASKSTVFGYESGASMMGMAAPARRVGLLMHRDTPPVLNASGWALFDAAVGWAANTSSSQTTTTSSPVNITVVKPTVSVTATDANASEAGPDAGAFTITRDGGTGAALNVTLTYGGTAANGTDYESTSQTVTIPAGSSSQVVSINPFDDALVEGGEVVTLTLSTDNAYIVGQPSSASVTIADNDTHAPTVTLTQPSDGSTYTAPATITLEATASDADGSITKVEFFAGVTKVGEDTTSPYSATWSNAGPGSYALTAVATDNAGVSTISGAVNVTVTLPTVTIAATDANASEAGQDSAAFTVTRNGGTAAPLMVRYELTGTAINGTDYASLDGSVLIPAGAASALVTVVPTDDVSIELPETVVLTLNQNPAYINGTPNSAAVNIADNDTPTRVNVALAANGATANGSSTHTDPAYAAGNAINGSRVAAAGYWNDGTQNAFPDTLEVTFAGSKTIDEIDIYGLQDNLATVEPDEALMFTQYGLVAFDLQYWNASLGEWVSVPGARVSANNRVWRKFVFAPITTTKIKLTINDALAMWSRVVEIEAYEATNLALNKTATQSSTYQQQPAQAASKAVDGNTDGVFVNGSVSTTNNDAQAWWQVDLGSVQAISSVKLWNRTDCCGERLSNFHVFVSNEPFTSNSLAATIAQPGVSDYHVTGAAGTSFSQEVHRPGRYVRVQLVGTTYLTLAEVQVWRDRPDVATCAPRQSMPLDRFVRNFFQAALGRQPNANELQQWSDTLREADAEGEAQLIAAAQNFGRTLFFSPEYNARNRSDRDFVWDLYWAYLPYGPDQLGWNFWTDEVIKWGRAAKLPAFDTYPDFTNQLKRICPSLPDNNQLPVANHGGPYTGTTSAPVQFNGGGSSDADGALADHQWNFGDGVTATGAAPQHRYTSGGTKEVTLMVRDNRGALRSATTTATIQDNTPPVNGATFVSQTVPATMNVGQHYTVSVTMQNTGTTTWAPDSNHLLGAANPVDNTTWRVVNSEDGRVRVPGPIAPGATVTFTFEVVAPSTPGTRNFQRRMLQHGADWFGDHAPNVAVNVVGPVNVPTDGIASLSYDTASNRINNTGYEYDATGNLTRLPDDAGGWRRMRYDAAGRLVQVVNDAGTTALATYTYGDSSQRLTTHEAGGRTYYVWGVSGVMTEYIETDLAPGALRWSKNYIYFGGGLLATQTSDSGNAETLEFHHPDQLGSRLISNATRGGSYEQVTMPFGTAFEAESGGADRQRFAGYDRSFTTGLDYAVNRFYSSRQGRFTQVDPIGMGAASLDAPQSLNLYSYVTNDPVNQTDPEGLTGFAGPSFFSFGIGIGWGGGGFGIRTIFNGQYYSGWFWFGGARPAQPSDPPPPPVNTEVSSGSSSTSVSSSGGAETATLTSNVDASNTISELGGNFVLNFGSSFRTPADPVEPLGYGRILPGTFHRTSIKVVMHTEMIVNGAKVPVNKMDCGVVTDFASAAIAYSPVEVPTAQGTRFPPFGRHLGNVNGHVFARALGGPTVSTNFWSQNSAINNSEFKVFENSIRRTLTDHKDWVAFVFVLFLYPMPPVPHCEAAAASRGIFYRPYQAIYTVSYQKGKKVMRAPQSFVFQNPPG